MIIGVFTNDSKYKELFQAHEEIELAILLDSQREKMQLDEDIKAILIDGEAMSYQEIDRIRELFPNSQLFYKLHKVRAEVSTTNIRRICTANNVVPINEYFTIEQVVNEVTKALTGDEKNASKRVVSFFGTHPGVGVSTTVFSIAKSISERTNERVLVLSLNAWDPADYFFPYDGRYLNELKIDLNARTLTADKLTASLYQYKNFYHLAGNLDIKLQRYYTNEEIEHLIEVAKDTFDLVLIDGGTHFDNALATQAYVSSNLRFLVTSQDDKGYRGYFPHVFQQILEPTGTKRSEFMLILNKYERNMSLISDKDIEEELEISRITNLPNLNIVGPVSIRQNKLLYDLAEGEYKKGIDIVSNLIISEANLTEKEIVYVGSDSKKKRFLGLF